MPTAEGGRQMGSCCRACCRTCFSRCCFSRCCRCRCRSCCASSCCCCHTSRSTRRRGARRRTRRSSPALLRGRLARPARRHSPVGAPPSTSGRSHPLQTHQAVTCQAVENVSQCGDATLFERRAWAHAKAGPQDKCTGTTHGPGGSSAAAGPRSEQPRGRHPAYARRSKTTWR